MPMAGRVLHQFQSQLFKKPALRSFSASAETKQQFNSYVMPTYNRYDIALVRGKGSYAWDDTGKQYLDVSGGIAVNSLGHAHPEMVEAITEQCQRLMHTSNLYYIEPQGLLAKRLVQLFGGGGKVFFCNSGAEANEGLFKLARSVGRESGRYEILTTTNSFHGRTLSCISATGQDKIKNGFHPMVDGFQHVPFNDASAMRDAISAKTAAILVEGIQGEGGVTPTTAEYLLELRHICDAEGIMLMIDAVQCGHFRSGRFQSYQRVLEDHPERQLAESFRPDACSFAKSLGAGFPIGAFWAAKPFEDGLTSGMHGTTFGGSPLACAVGLKVLDIIDRDGLELNARDMGTYLKQGLLEIAKRRPGVVADVRGLGLMQGVLLHDASDIAAFAPQAETKPSSGQLVGLLNDLGVLTVPAGTNIVRLLPPLNISKQEIEELLDRVDSAVAAASSP